MRDNLLTALPEHQRTEESANSILYSLLTGESQLWIGVEDPGDGDWTIYGYMVTSMITDHFTQTKNLLVHAGVSLNNKASSPIMYTEGSRVVKEFAKANGCKCIIGYTSNDNLARMLNKATGADISMRLFSIGVE
jgi:hypothetical protein